MAYDNGASRGTVIYFTLKSKRNNVTDPHFAKIEKNEAGEYEATETATRISGNITGLKVDRWTDDKGKPRHNALITVRDGEEVYELKIPLETVIGRSVMNTILGTTEWGKFEISLYTNKKGYANAYITNDGKQTPWKYAIDELNKGRKEYETPDGKMYDYSEPVKRLVEATELHSKLFTDDAYQDDPLGLQEDEPPF